MGSADGGGGDRALQGKDATHLQVFHSC